MIPVDGHRRDVRLRRQHLEQTVVSPGIELLHGHVRQVATEQQIVRLNRIHLRNKALQLFRLEQRIHVNVAKENRREPFRIL